MTEPAGRPPHPVPTQPGAARPPGATPLQIAQNAPDAGKLRLGGEQLLKLGTVVADRYEVNALLGRGGFGEVYRARHTGTHEMVALKVLRPELLAESAAVDRFTAEARLCASLRHPNTVRVFDFGQTPDKALYLAMEFLEGESLEQILAKGPLPPKRAVHIVIQVLRSLAEAHGRKIVHRDLKPDNVFVGSVAGEADFVHVIDFGIAKFLAEGANAALTQAGAIIGTPHYMSPEQIRGETLDARADLYSVGVLLYRCLSGRHPYDGDTTFAILAAHLGDALPSLQACQVDPALEAIAVRALSRDRQARYATADQFRTALEQWQVSAPAEVDTARTQISMDVVKPHAPRIATEPSLPPGAQTVVTAPGANPELLQTTIGPPPEMTAVDAVPRAPAAPPPPPPAKPAALGKSAPPGKAALPARPAPAPKPLDAQAQTTAEAMPQAPAEGGTVRGSETAVISSPSTQVVALPPSLEKKGGVAGDSQRPRPGKAPPGRRAGPEPVRLNSDSARAKAAAAQQEPADNDTVAMNILAPQLETEVVSLEEVQRRAENSGELRVGPAKGKSAWPVALGALLALLVAGAVAWWLLFAQREGAVAPSAEPAPPRTADPAQLAPAQLAPAQAAPVAAAPQGAAPADPGQAATADAAAVPAAEPASGAAAAPPAAAAVETPPAAAEAGAKASSDGDASGKVGASAHSSGKKPEAVGEKPHKAAKSCPSTPGSKEWCTTCPAARDLSSSSPHYCACLQHSGSTSGLAYYCKCVFPKEYHKVGSTPYCKCNPRDPACHE